MPNPDPIIAVYDALQSITAALATAQLPAGFEAATMHVPSYRVQLAYSQRALRRVHKRLLATVTHYNHHLPAYEWPES